MNRFSDPREQSLAESFGIAAKGFSIFLRNFLPQLLIFNEVSSFKVEVENVHMLYAWTMYSIDNTNVVRSFSKKIEHFLFTHELSLEQILILKLNNYDKRKHHRILENLHCIMMKFYVVG